MLKIRAIYTWLFVVCSLIVGLTGCKAKTTAPAPTAEIVKPLEVLSVDGIGPINATTPFNLHLLTEAFPEFNVTQQTNFDSGNQYPIISISKDLKPLLIINPDVSGRKIFSVMVQDNQIGNQQGHMLGTRFADIYPYDKATQCTAGVEDMKGKVLCASPKAVNILYLFSGAWQGPEKDVPPKDVLANWALESIIWKPLAK